MAQVLKVFSSVLAVQAHAYTRRSGTCSIDSSESCTVGKQSSLAADSTLLQLSTLAHDGLSNGETASARRSEASCYGELEALAVDEGAEIGVTWTESLETCKRSCSDNSNCESMSFCPGWHGCWLKGKSFDGAEASQTKADCKTYFKKACTSAPTPSPTPAPTPAPTPSPTLAPTPSPTPSPQPAPTGSDCYAELSGLAADEGNEVGTVWTESASECQQRCSANAACNSISFCKQWSGCWLKDRTLSGNEAVVSKGECKTMYKTSCGGSRVPVPVPAPAPTGVKIRAVSYNLYWWNAFGQNPWQGENIIKNINNNLNADVLGLQECDSPAHVAERTEYDAASPFQGAQGVMARSGMFTVGATGSQDIRATGKWGPRYVTWAQLTHKTSGRTFWHFNTHWCVHNGNGQTCGPDKRYVGAKNMLAIIQEKAGQQPAIITGDFNAAMSEPGPQHFLSNGFSLASVSWVDAVFYSSAHFRVGETGTGSHSGSDHAPVFAELEFI